MNARTLIVLILLIVAVIVISMWMTGEDEPIDYAAIKQPVLNQALTATTDDDRLTAILDAHRAFFEIVREIDSPEEAQVALPHLTELAQSAQNLDEKMLDTPEARRDLLQRRNAEVQDIAMELGAITIRLGFRPKQFTILTEPMDTLASTLQE